VQKMVGPIIIIYASSNMVLCRVLPFGSHDDSTCVKILSGINF